MLDELEFLILIKKFRDDFFKYGRKSYIDISKDGITLIIMMNGNILIKSMEGNIFINYDDCDYSQSYIITMFGITDIISITDIEDKIKEVSSMDDLEYSLRYGRLPSFYIKNLRENIPEFTSELNLILSKYDS